jgi:hypothetical protein
MSFLDSNFDSRQLFLLQIGNSPIWNKVRAGKFIVLACKGRSPNRSNLAPVISKANFWICDGPAHTTALAFFDYRAGRR